MCLLVEGLTSVLSLIGTVHNYYVAPSPSRRSVFQPASIIPAVV